MARLGRKSEETPERNYRWHLGKLSKGGLVKSVESREEREAK